MVIWTHRNNDYVVHIYCFDPCRITDKIYKCDKYRLKFRIESIDNLNDFI